MMCRRSLPIVAFGVALLAAWAAGCGGESRSDSSANPESTPTPAAEGVATAVFAVQGMTCGGCEVGVERALLRVPGVVSAEAEYETSRARCRYDPKRVDVAQLTRAIESVGYSAQLIESSD